MRKRLALLLAVLMSVLWQMPTPVSAAPAERNGLRGDYYLASAAGRFDFAELKASIIDPNLEMADLNPTFKLLTGREDDVTVRWTGQITAEYSETYTFSIIGDNGFRLWVDGRPIIDHWVDDWDREQTGTPIALQAGRKYDVKVEYFEHFGGANLRLRWQSPSQPKAIVPMSAFTVPAGYQPDGPYDARLNTAGDVATLTYAKPLAALPANAAQKLGVTVGAATWPVTSATLKSPDTVELKLKYPVPSKAGSTVRTSYDGSGGITYADGAPLAAYPFAYVVNASAYILRTPWADEMNPANPLPEYPRPQLVRDRWQSLNGTWQFAPAKAGEAVPTGRDLPERIVVPYPVESQLSGIGRHEQRMWYRRTFDVPPDWRGERLLLHLDAVDWQAAVYVNGKEVTTHKGGYGRISVDVTGALKRGARQELVVGVYDPTDNGAQAIGKQRLNPGGIWYTSVSGIWQTVWIEPVEAARIDRVDTTPDVKGEALYVTVQGTGGTATVIARDGDTGRDVVGKVTGPVGQKLRLPVPDPRLWSPDDPHLYDLEVKVGKDEVKSYFGMRSIEVSDNRMLLNGKPVFQIGPLDQGFWPDGIYTPPTDEALRYDLEQTKALGFNAVRKHVKVESDRWYHHADKLGLLVWQDMPSAFRTSDRPQFEAELRELVDQHRSSPSIVMWVPFNEGWGQYDQARVADLVKSWDPSRLVNNMSGINCCGAVDGGNGDVKDFHIYPGPGNPGKPVGTRANVIGEYGGLALPVVGHTWSGGGWGYAVEPDPAALTNRYVNMVKELERLHACEGLSAAIYTQTTDVETEINGLMTYDRAITKPDVKRVHDAHKALTSAINPTCS
ncbi:Glycosyl hydrolases family 2, TIM barrel domain [Nonomuraea solani]|uniref:Glycosyl hydrolases family 2, TIM barrel domain n=1 Tax=Nonomuraea solani TaxID=1144553 RepID=A0A1H6EK57_9ACTN|nr:PA14 domain-containing protein [Nonomuraea solani]SEG97406.1 Glycosyl hydrolases family 2, TIM barrel domain [Nonomuraea solani]